MTTPRGLRGFTASLLAFSYTMDMHIKKIASKVWFWLAVALIVYMPLHVLIVQSASLLTGGLEAWKAAKDVLVFVLFPLLLIWAYKKQVFSEKGMQRLLITGAVYGALHGLFLLFVRDDHNYSTLVASVYNTRYIIYFLLGVVVAVESSSERTKKIILTVCLLVGVTVATFGVAQYFLPKDMLTHVGYSLDRGVKPMFFIDDKPDLPRVMSTIKDPNSLAAYLIVPLLLAVTAMLQKSANKALFIRPFRRGTLIVFIAILSACILLSFSRGGLLAAIAALVTLLSIVKEQWMLGIIKKHLVVLVVLTLFAGFFAYQLKDTYVFQNYVFHADQSTVLADPNELRVQLTQKALTAVLDEPLGYGPGKAGLIAITNPTSGILTENHYLQIAYEVGWLGFALFAVIYGLIGYWLFRDGLRSENHLARILFAAWVGYGFYSLLIHLWSNEAIALQWWLLAGLSVGGSLLRVRQNRQ